MPYTGLGHSPRSGFGKYTHNVVGSKHTYTHTKAHMLTHTRYSRRTDTHLHVYIIDTRSFVYTTYTIRDDRDYHGLANVCVCEENKNELLVDAHSLFHRFNGQ